MIGDNDKCVLSILDNDHVLSLVSAVMTGPSEASNRILRNFFAPEEVDLLELYRMRTGIAETRVVEPPPEYGSTSTPPADTTAIVLRRGRLSAADMDTMPELRLIQRLGSGRDVVDVDAASARGIEVDFIARRSLEWTAEHALLLMLALRKKLVLGDRIVREGAAADAYPGTASVDSAYNWAALNGISGLAGQTLGIVGMGEVGSLVAARARAFGMEVIYVSKEPALPSPDSLEKVEMAELLKRSDIVSLHVPATADNHGMIDSRFLQAMRQDALLINTSRGSLIDEDALHDALESGRLAGAGLDVHAQEPRGFGDKISALDTVVLTPHIAAGSRTAVLPEIAALLDNLRRHFPATPSVSSSNPMERM
jgi:lactate dehydrogenase-like 2-hydroxyacid dehydrogenase